jgi:hypothetical protein
VMREPSRELILAGHCTGAGVAASSSGSRT